VGTFEEHTAKLMRAIKEAQHREPPTLSGQTYPVGMGGRTVPMDRVHVEAALQNACPRGLSYLYHYLCVAMVSTDDFEAACDHFGLRSVLRDITKEEVAGEVRERRGRDAEPSTAYLLMDLDPRFSREEADARIAIVKRRIAEAREKYPKTAAATRAA